MNTRPSVVVLPACAVLTLANRARAYRPFDSTDAAVAPPGEFELELGPVHYLRMGPTNALLAPAVVANLGLFDRCEAVLEGQELILLDKAPGESRVQLIDTGASLKFVLREGTLQDKDGPSIGTEVGVLLPEVNADHGVGGLASLLVSERWTIGTLHLNAEGARTREGHAGLFLGSILEGPYEWRVRPVGEIFYEREFDVDRIVSGLVGFIARVDDRFAPDAGARFARMGDLNVFELRAGFTWAFEVWNSER